MSDAICTKYGCDYQLDLDGQVTCSNCGATSLAVHLFKDNVCRHCGLKEV